LTTTSLQYRRLERLWQEGWVVLLDGGVGSELERLGFPRERNIGELWGTRALYEAPELTREVHRRYVRAGADVITTNTWRIDRTPSAEAEGLVSRGAGRWQEKVRPAVGLAREAARELGRADRRRRRSAQRVTTTHLWHGSNPSGPPLSRARACLEAPCSPAPDV
jgi:S-methylmethionine-dependent homocysteine/selenocysteine methylase